MFSSPLYVRIFIRRVHRNKAIHPPRLMADAIRNNEDEASAKAADAGPARGRFMRSVHAQVKRTQRRIIGALRTGQRVPTPNKPQSPMPLQRANTGMSVTEWSAQPDPCRPKNRDIYDLDRSGNGPMVTNWMADAIDERKHSQIQESIEMSARRRSSSSSAHAYAKD